MEHLAKGADSVVLRRFVPNFSAELPEDLPATAIACVIIDTETTGLEVSDAIVEVALVPFVLDTATGQILAVLPALGGLQDPGFPMSPDVIAVHGITDDDVKGQTIDWTSIVRALAEVDLVIAHNAGFDRPRVTRELEGRRGELADDVVDRAVNALWACTVEQVPWTGMPSKRQEILAVWHGFFYTAHRADADCLALLHLLDVAGALRDLWQTAQMPTFEVWAVNSPFAAKDVVKARGYRWFADQKCWVRGVASEAAAADESAWLAANVYGRGPNPAQVRRIEPRSRFR